MFATIIGPYPAIPDARTVEERLGATIADQLDAGLGMLADGLVHEAGDDPGGVVDAWRAADAVGHHLAAERGLEPPLIKACLLGPWSAAAGDASRVRAAAERLAPAIDALFEAGAPVVQLTEPGVGHVEPADRGAIELLSETLAGLAGRVAALGHLSLALAGGGPTAVPPDALMVGFGSYVFDLILSPDDWAACARVPGASGLIVGVVDARAARPGALEVGVWGARYAASMGGRGAARTGICPGAGLEALGRDAARTLLAFTAEVARAADMPDAALAQVVGPADLNARSAALGAASLGPRRASRARR